MVGWLPLTMAGRLSRELVLATSKSRAFDRYCLFTRNLSFLAWLTDERATTTDWFGVVNIESRFQTWTRLGSGWDGMVEGQASPLFSIKLLAELILASERFSSRLLEIFIDLAFEITCCSSFNHSLVQARPSSSGLDISWSAFEINQRCWRSKVSRMTLG